MKYFCLILILTTLALTGISQDITDVRTIGGAYNDYGSEVIETSDGGFAIIGTTGSYGTGLSSMYLVKMNAELNVEWTSVYGGHNLEWGQSIIEVSDGFLLLGYTNSFGAGGYDVYLVKTDIEGNQLWQKTYGGSDWDFGYKMIELDGTYYIVGETWSFSNGGSDGYLIQIDSEGNELWSEHFGGNDNDALYGLFKGLDNLIVVGTNKSVSEKSKVHLIQVNANNQISEFFIGDDNLWHEGRTGIMHSNGNYYITGAKEFGNHSNYLLFRLDTDFATLPLNPNTLGGELKDFAYDLIEVDLNQITLVGEGASYTGSVGAYILRLTEFGQFQVAPTHGESGVDIARNVIITSTNRLMFVGETDSFGQGNFDVYLVQLPTVMVSQEYTLDVISFSDPLLTTVNESVNNHLTDLKVFPNPAQTHIFFESEIQFEHISLFNMRGQLIKRFNNFDSNNRIDLNGVSAGTYLLEFSNDSNTFRSKVVVH
jgi:hypothetical protein